MATEITNKNIIIDRDYSDNFSVKETAMTTLGQKYFGDVELSGLNVGLLGFTLEQIANITEDSFNTASVMVNELFPNKAIIPESIYSHAAIFQMDNSFATPAVCTFAMLIEEKEFLKYATSIDKEHEFPKHYFIDKKTIINVEGIPFTLDYDIEIICSKISDKDVSSIYKYRARYDIKTEEVIDDISGESTKIELRNSMSDITNVFLKIRRIQTQKDALLMVVFNARQLTRTTKFDTITNNTRVNYPILEFTFNGKLAGFDIYYKNPGSPYGYLPMSKQVFYSIPSRKPFCYYRLKNSNTLLITFTSRDGYFKPDFNCDIMIDIYTTLGKDGNFTAYEGNNIDVQRFSDTYKYNGNMVYAIRPISDSSNGNDSINLEALQALTVEAYSTATELSTEDDILKYFYDYKYRYGTEMLVFKRRDDIFERLFSSFLVLKNNDYIYPTNTLRLSINKQEFDTGQDDSSTDNENEDVGIYTLSPGHIFVYKDDSLDTVQLIPHLNAWNLNENPKFYMSDNLAYVPYKDGIMTKYKRYNSSGQYDSTTTILPKTAIEYDFVYTNPFLMYVSQIDNIVGIYQTAIHDDILVEHKDDRSDDIYNTYITSKIVIDRNHDMYKRYKFTVELTPSASAMKSDSNDILNTSNVINDYIKTLFEYDEKSKTYRILRDVDTDKIINVDTDEDGQYKVDDDGYYIINDNIIDTIDNNEVRVFLVFRNKGNNGYNVGYIELLPTGFNEDDKSITKFEALLYTNDEISSVKEINITNNYTSINTSLIDYLTRIHSTVSNKTSVSLDITDMPAEIVIFHKRDGYDANGNIDINTWYDGTEYQQRDNINKSYSYKPYSYYDEDEEGNTIIVTNQLNPVNNLNKNYIEVTRYKTSVNINLIKPMNMMRSTLAFENIVDQNNIQFSLSLIPFVRADILNDEDAFNIFTDRLMKSYTYIENSITRLRNNTHIDVKFYNTYGKSNNYVIKGLVKEILYILTDGSDQYYDKDGNFYDVTGLIDETKKITIEELSQKILDNDVTSYETNNYIDNEEIINKVNVTIKFDVTFLAGTDLVEAEDKVSTYIKQYIESINTEGTNELYISNLIKNIENNFSEVHHLKFRGINGYDTSYQTISVKKYDLDTLTKEERRNYVPELLVIEEGTNVGVLISSTTTTSI